MYKSVVIMGPGFVNIYDIMKENLNNETIVIGNGQDTLKGEKFSILKNKIDLNTRIDIILHGKPLHTDATQHGSIYIEHDKLANTGILLKHITSINPGLKLNIHLRSCYGELAQNCIKFLPAGSVLITHTHGDTVASGPLQEYVLTNSLLEKNNFLSFYDFIDLVSASFIDPESNINHMTIQFDINQLCENPLQFLKNQLRQFSQYFSSIDENKITEQFVDKYFIGQMIEACRRIASDKLISKLNSLEAHYIKSLINCDLNGWSLIFEASSSHNIELVKFLLDQGDNPNKIYKISDITISPIYFSIFSEVPSKVLFDLLKSYGASTDIEITSHGDLLLHHAVINNNIEAIKFLIKCGENVNSIRSFDNATPLIVATTQENYQLSQELLNSDANVNAKNIKGFTPLISATAQGKTDLVRLLLDYNADTNDCLSDGFNSLMIAQEKQFNDIVTILGEGNFTL